MSVVGEIMPLQSFLSCAKKIKNKVIDRCAAQRLYSQLGKLLKENPEINGLFPYAEFRGHYVYEPARQTLEHPDIFINQIRYYRMYKYFQEKYPEIFSNDVKVVDVGDTSGILFRAMKRKGLSVNINREVLEYIRGKGVDAEQGNIENLPFKDKSFDYAFCFECLEHLPNPIKALEELSRVTKKNIFVSIPFVRYTKIYSREFWQDLKSRSFEEGGWNETEVREVDSHKFEFSTEDFKKVITHARLRYIDSFPINYFMPLGKTHRNFGSYFNFFVLVPIE